MVVLAVMVLTEQVLDLELLVELAVLVEEFCYLKL
jgi:hypothetical protein